MSAFHCSCGFAIDKAEEFSDHFFEVFDRGDGPGTDGRVHHEAASEGGRLVCSCGFGTEDVPEFDDHLLLVLTPLDGIGNDGDKHVPVDTATPVRWFLPDNDDK